LVVGERQRRTCGAALAIASGLGVRVQRALIVSDWNNTIIRLVPSSIVAKVGTSHFDDAELESLERELAVASHLAACGAPVISPGRSGARCGRGAAAGASRKPARRELAGHCE
jgi:hypothetical protein